MPTPTERVSADWIVDKAAEILGVKPIDIKTTTPRAEHREAWRIVAYAAYSVSDRSLVEIGQALGGATHSRVQVAREKVKARMTTDAIFRLGVAKLLEELRVALF